MPATAVVQRVQKVILKGGRKGCHALTYINIIPHFNRRPFRISSEHVAPQQKVISFHLLSPILCISSPLPSPSKKLQLAQPDTVWRCQIVSINVADPLCLLMANAC